ncbi:hypothetical protein ScPMuIL_018492 [Solemya velum]
MYSECTRRNQRRLDTTYSMIKVRTDGYAQLLLQQGHKIDYGAGADALTCAPETFRSYVCKDDDGEKDSILSTRSSEGSKKYNNSDWLPDYGIDTDEDELTTLKMQKIHESVEPDYSSNDEDTTQDSKEHGAYEKKFKNDIQNPAPSLQTKAKGNAR